MSDNPFKDYDPHIDQTEVFEAEIREALDHVTDLCLKYSIPHVMVFQIFQDYDGSVIMTSRAGVPGIACGKMRSLVNIVTNSEGLDIGKWYFQKSLTPVA